MRKLIYAHAQTQFHRGAPKPLDAFVQCMYAQTVTPLVMMLLRDATPLVAAGHFA